MPCPPKASGAESVPQPASRKAAWAALKPCGVVTEPLLTRITKAPEGTYDIIIALNELFPEGVDRAFEWVKKALDALAPPPKKVGRAATYVFATLTGNQVLELADLYRNWVKTQGDRFKSPVYRVWEDPDIHPCLTHSLSTIKGDACHRAFNSFGEGIVWAVLDSGIQKDHPHFAAGNIDETLSESFVGGVATEDVYGHGTHVAGIIAGSWKTDPAQTVVATEMLVEGTEQTEIKLEDLAAISGIAPKATLVSYKVLNNLCLDTLRRMNRKSLPDFQSFENPVLDGMPEPHERSAPEANARNVEERRLVVANRQH